MRDALHPRVLLLGLSLACGSNLAVAQVHGIPGLPVQDWLEAGEVEEVGWDISIDGPALRMDQRIEIVVRGRIHASDLGAAGSDHELLFWHGVQPAGGGEWVAQSEPIRHSVEPDLPDNADIEFEIQVFVTPGDYVFWILMADETTGQHNLKVEALKVTAVADEPFPDAFTGVPVVEFPDTDWSEDDLEQEGTGDLVMPVRTGRPIDVELIAALSTPEQWSSLGANKKHKDNIQDALVALSQLDVENGSLSLTGLDLVRRRSVFEQRDLAPLDRTRLEEAFEAANPGSISLDDLASRTENPRFLRRFVEERAGPRGQADPAGPLQVFVFVTGITRFDEDADVEELELAGDCGCVAYHIRIRQDIGDLFDEVQDIIDPLDPETYDVLTPNDLRRAIGRIVRDLEHY